MKHKCVTHDETFGDKLRFSTFDVVATSNSLTEKKTSHSMRRESLTDINIEDFEEYTQIISMSLDHGIQISVLVCLFLINQKFPLRRSQSNPNPVPIRQTIVLMFLTA